MRNAFGKEIICNPVTSEKLLVLESTDEVFKMGFSIKPRSAIAGEHFHPFQQQKILVTSGELHCRINGKEHAVQEGEMLTIAPGAQHFQWNPTDFEATAIEEYRPAKQIHNFFRVLFALASDGKTNRKGIPYPLIGAALTVEFSDTIRVTSLGLRFLFAVFAPLSAFLGYRQTIRNYVEKFEKEDKLRAAAKSAIKRMSNNSEKIYLKYHSPEIGNYHDTWN